MEGSKSRHKRLGHRRQYTPEEEKWLKKNYGSEYKFLRAHRLSIYKEEDRDGGRAIARTLIRHDDCPIVAIALPPRRAGRKLHHSEIYVAES